MPRYHLYGGPLDGYQMERMDDSVIAIAYRERLDPDAPDDAELPVTVHDYAPINFHINGRPVALYVAAGTRHKNHKLLDSHATLTVAEAQNADIVAQAAGRLVGAVVAAAIKGGIDPLLTKATLTAGPSPVVDGFLTLRVKVEGYWPAPYTKGDNR